ncbi:hypothetical protein BT96DRAFT_996948 [Gymnopus androsaceus JB14]|uniref:Uncharacterized protein n=1 Tax=Gymnopus androsaceus JB14 TaxID=1447944 RepID=A0A6A4HEV2_9AGAR|nr:hypothetical protein BT96DRAFT_996948 [Gymnopus androsaceus JB14]
MLPGVYSKTHSGILIDSTTMLLPFMHPGPAIAAFMSGNTDFVHHVYQHLFWCAWSCSWNASNASFASSSKNSCICLQPHPLQHRRLGLALLWRPTKPLRCLIQQPTFSFLNPSTYWCSVNVFVCVDADICRIFPAQIGMGVSGMDSGVGLGGGGPCLIVRLIPPIAHPFVPR